MSKKKKKAKRKVKTTCIYVQNIPLTLKGYYKAYCAKKGLTMSRDIVEHMKSTTRTARQLDEDKEYDVES